MINFPRVGHKHRAVVSTYQYAVPPEHIKAQVLAAGWATGGLEVAAFEHEFAALVGARSAVAVSSRVSAIELSLRALRLPRGSRVLVSTLTSMGVFQAIVRAGLRPVLLDVSVGTGMPTPATVEEAVSRGPVGEDRPRAMMVMHWAGDPADVTGLAEAANLPPHALLEDAAHALGTSLGERRVGGAGTACFSFYSTSNLPIGEGGMVTTEDPERAAAIRLARIGHRFMDGPSRRHPHRNGAPYGVLEGGFPVHLTDLSAAIGRQQLPHLQPWQRRREGLAARYDVALADIPGVTLPHRPPPGTGRHAWNHYPVRVECPDDVRETLIGALNKAGLRTGSHPIPLHQVSHCRGLSDVPSTGLPGADRLTSQLVLLPIDPQRSEQAAHQAAKVLSACLAVVVRRDRGVANDGREVS